MSCIKKRGVVDVAWIRRDEYVKGNEQNRFFEMLDRGTDDMEVRCELSVQEVLQKINELRMVRRNVRV